MIGNRWVLGMQPTRCAVSSAFEACTVACDGLWPIVLSYLIVRSHAKSNSYDRFKASATEKEHDQNSKVNPSTSIMQR
jgi:hypothetical protein